MASNDRVRQRGITIHRPIIYGNSAVVLTQKERETLPTPDHTHRWTVADDLTYFIKRVTFKLHDTYTNPTRALDKPPFEITETGVRDPNPYKLRPESGEKAVVAYHHLKLHPWTAVGSGEPEIPPLDQAMKMGPVHSWQYDEIVFHDPFQSFLNILTAHPPTPLPRHKTRPVPFHTAHPASLEASKGGVPEFTLQMERDEAERLETARKAVVAESDKWRERLIEKEKELEKLKRLLEARGDSVD
ncbi:uncharacterized protein B0H18DRAFT_965675 [Fomitopsis serialis]|uniref:uncharacterized protein n=1 Tax=Fomitopsis serialis TaxID=139415 RepID=UPI0020085BD1|nr:uncharacterized protein B0H18DRAFT_965675 [Neoantrodia serialis]KAH9938116.1 hypothetical protein B0H18DRAFT_965675 [Neoantrodia serialis]